jgi:restriction system protein
MPDLMDVRYNIKTARGEQGMARRKKTSPAEDIMDLVAMLPWWAGVTLGVISYVLLHGAASQAVVPTA